MTPSKWLDEASAALSRYAPTALVHLLLVIWINARVLKPGVLPSGESIWGIVSALIDNAQHAINLDVARWYVLVFVAVGYLTFFQWIAAFVISLPLLRVVRYPARDPELLAHACNVLRLKPDLWSAQEELASLVDQYSAQARDTNTIAPGYRWLFETQTTWFSYYKSLAVALVGCVIWLISGAVFARSSGVVWELFFLLVASCQAVRWRMRRDDRKKELNLGHWALREYTRRHDVSRIDALQAKRRELVHRELAIWNAQQRHPAFIVTSIARILPRKYEKKIRSKIRFPASWPNDDWAIVSSASSRYGQDEPEVPSALGTQAFRERFSALLECNGAGLCIVAPRDLALAPSVAGGAGFDFATRSHAGWELRFNLRGSERLDGSLIDLVDFDRQRSFIVLVGAHPIERLAQGDFPSDGRHWHQLLPPYKDEAIWRPKDSYRPWPYAEFSLATSASLELGSSYLYGARTRSGTEAVVAFQCFRVGDSERLLVAFRVLDVRTFADDHPPRITPWWQLRAWKELRGA